MTEQTYMGISKTDPSVEKSGFTIEDRCILTIDDTVLQPEDVIGCTQLRCRDYAWNGIFICNTEMFVKFATSNESNFSSSKVVLVDLPEKDGSYTRITGEIKEVESFQEMGFQDIVLHLSMMTKE
jgi:hypothetical protein